MTKITVDLLNNSKLYIDVEYEIALEISATFTVFAEGYKFHPLFKARRWDGKIRFFNIREKTLPVGLLSELYTFAKGRGYQLDLTDKAKNAYRSGYTKEEFAKEIKTLKLYAYGEEISYRDYQLRGIYEALATKRRLFSSNTSSGKSSIQYGIIRLLQSRVEGRILLIVPSTQLVEQMYSDFMDYASGDDWSVQDECARLYSGYKPDHRKQILISTWQSLQEKDPEYFEQFDACLVDEAHQAKAKQLSKIMDMCVNAEYRLAFTGSVPKERVSVLTIAGHFGPTSVLQTSKQAMDKGYISQLKIECLVLKHQKEKTDLVKKMKYQDEVSFICQDEDRMNVIVNLAKSLPGNTLILTARVESHGKVMVDRITKAVAGQDKVVHGIFGEVDTKVREEIRQQMETTSNNITVGNYQIVSTGWSCRNLHNIILAFPSKSFTRVVQTIGRGLRKHESKEFCRLFDVVDSFSEINYCWDHFVERTGIYEEEGFPFSVREIQL